MSHLVVPTGATLNTRGQTVYFATAEIEGTVDDLSNLVEIEMEACVGDSGRQQAQP